MTKEELDFRINLVLAKARNLCYYSSLDTRERVTYMHIVRGLRKDLIGVLKEIPDVKEYKDIKAYILELVRAIDPKIGTDDCKIFISTVLTNLLKKRGIL